MGGSPLLTFALTSVGVLVVVVALLAIAVALTNLMKRRERPRKTMAQPRSPHTAAPAAATRAAQQTPQQAPAPSFFTDDLADQIAALEAQLSDAQQLLARAPTGYSDLILLHGERVEVERALHILRAAQHVRAPADRAAMVRTAQQNRQRLERLKQSVATLIDDHTRRDRRERAVRQQAARLATAIDALQREPSLPIDCSDIAAQQHAAVQAIEAMPEDAPFPSHDQLRQRLHLLRGLAEGLAQGEQSVALAGEHRAALQRLLAQPELAEQPEWHRAVRALAQRSRSIVGVADADALLSEADALLRRRRGLLAGSAVLPMGSYQISATQLPDVLYEAQSLQAEIRGLAQRARRMHAALRSIVA